MDITVVIPLYNRKEYIRRTLESIIDSNAGLAQIIIVDNGSTDGSLEYARTLASLYDTDIIVTEEATRGAAAARNKGLSLCHTEWIYFFDSDDIFTGLPEITGSDADMICFPCRQNVNGKISIRDYKAVTTPHTTILNSMLNTVSMVFRTSFLHHIGGWNEKCQIWDDWELGIRALTLSQKTEWKTDKAYHMILVHSDSITGTNFTDKIKDLLNTMEQAILFMLDQKDSKEKDRSLFALFLRCYILSGNLLKENSHAASEEVHGLINRYYHVGGNDYKMGRFFEWYVSKGLRGAWKIALHIVSRL